MGFCQISALDESVPKIAIVIPARLASERLPRKILLDFHGLPMIEHVRRRALMNSLSVPVYVVSGDDEILKVIQEFGGRTLKSNLEHPNGLSRVHEASKSLNYTHYIVLQGDEMLVLPSQLDELIKIIRKEPQVNFWNQITTLSSENEIDDSSIVKCFINNDGQIFSIFRKSPLTVEPSIQLSLLKKICGLFAISKIALGQYFEETESPLQVAESIEQLRYIELGHQISCINTEFNFPSVNLREDITKIEDTFKILESQSDLLQLVLNYAN